MVKVKRMCAVHAAEAPPSPTIHHALNFEGFPQELKVAAEADLKRVVFVFVFYRVLCLVSITRYTALFFAHCEERPSPSKKSFR